jgi:4-carboxymuconolactone decarboxylase
MKRIKLLTRPELNEMQCLAYDAVMAGPRGRVPAPMTAWLYSPEFANRAQNLGAYLRYDTSLPPRLSELAILVVARIWTAQYEWCVHKKEALKAGVEPEIIAGIAQRQRPQFVHVPDAIVHDFSMELCTSHRVSDELYRNTLEAIGERGTVELVGLLGYYSLIAMTLNTFEIDVPEGFHPELE